jgi:hypothetical protein
MPGTEQNQQPQQDDYVAPRDSAEKKAQDFEDKYDHQRGGHEKQGTSGSVKPHSVRSN